MHRIMLCVGVLGSMALGACGDDGGDGGGGGGNAIGQGVNRGGPEALSGFTWGSQQSVNGIDFDFSFEFGDSTLVATNACSLDGDVLVAEVEVPITYRYRATITQAGESGDESCYVTVAASTFDFTIAGNTMTATSGDQTVQFTATGTRSGVYGDWSAEGDGFVLTWNIGSGKINATAACPGGLSAKVSVPATLENFVDVPEGKQVEVGDESFNCSVGVAAGTFGYRFSGKTLVMSFGAEEMSFTPE